MHCKNHRTKIFNQEVNYFVYIEKFIKNESVACLFKIIYIYMYIYIYIYIYNNNVHAQFQHYDEKGCAVTNEIVYLYDFPIASSV